MLALRPGVSPVAQIISTKGVGGWVRDQRGGARVRGGLWELLLKRNEEDLSRYSRVLPHKNSMLRAVTPQTLRRELSFC